MEQEQSAEVRKGLELFLLAHLCLADDADRELKELGLHRTHHRILYLAASRPGLSVGDLVQTLRLTPQAVQQPMRRLIDGGYLEQRNGATDRRMRRLFVTAKGAVLHANLSNRQYGRLARAYRAAGTDGVRAFLDVMENLLDPADRADSAILT